MAHVIFIKIVFFFSFSVLHAKFVKDQKKEGVTHALPKNFYLINVKSFTQTLSFSPRRMNEKNINFKVGKF